MHSISRVKIQRVLPADTVAVYKCDFGDITFLNTDSLRTLTTEFRQMPQLAIPAHLHGKRYVLYLSDFLFQYIHKIPNSIF